MNAADSINADSTSRGDRDLVRRLAVVLAFVFLFTAAFAHLERTYSRKFFDITGRAQWIWAQHRMSDDSPLAFFAARDFDLPENRIHTHLKILGDPEYTVYLNGQEIAGRRVGEQRALDFYDISQLVKTGRNRIVVAVRAPQGTGGLIGAIGIAPESPNWIVTDGAWTIHRRWTPDLLLREPRDGQRETPAIVGEPPIGRWNYLSVEPQMLASAPAAIAGPLAAFERIGLIPRIKTAGGIAVATQERERATAFDFGFTEGRLRLTNETPRNVTRLVNVRFAYAEDELGTAEWNLRPVVFAPGEPVVTTSEPHKFRYAMVFGRGIRAEVVKQ
jgi:hypothetical protein